LFQLSQSFESCKIEVEAEVETKTRGNADDIRPEVEVVGEQDDERFWAKIPVIREKKKRGNQKDLTPAPDSKKKAKTAK
jgi:hypothetical protein